MTSIDWRGHEGAERTSTSSTTLAKKSPPVERAENMERISDGVG
jgi:hypothetical protein